MEIRDLETCPWAEFVVYMRQQFEAIRDSKEVLKLEIPREYFIDGGNN